MLFWIWARVFSSNHALRKGPDLPRKAAICRDIFRLVVKYRYIFQHIIFGKSQQRCGLLLSALQQGVVVVVAVIIIIIITIFLLFYPR